MCAASDGFQYQGRSRGAQPEYFHSIALLVRSLNQTCIVQDAELGRALRCCIKRKPESALALDSQGESFQAFETAQGSVRRIIDVELEFRELLCEPAAHLSNPAFVDAEPLHEYLKLLAIHFDVGSQR